MQYRASVAQLDSCCRHSCRICDMFGETRLDAARQALRQEQDHRHSAETLTKLVAGSGFSVARSIEQSFSMRFADGSALLRHSLVKWFLDGWRHAIGVEHERRIFDKLEAELNAAAVRDGCVEMQVPMLYLEGLAVRQQSPAGRRKYL